MPSGDRPKYPYALHPGGSDTVDNIEIRVSIAPVVREFRPDGYEKWETLLPVARAVERTFNADLKEIGIYAAIAAERAVEAFRKQWEEAYVR